MDMRKQRQCITDNLYTQHQCPQCRTAVPTEGTCLPTSHILKSLAEKAKEAENIKKEHGHEKAEVAELCPEHEEKLKLFCVTDQQLACIICRDGERHEGHKFNPVKEAAASLRRELETGMEKLCGDIDATESLASTQREEITKTKKKSQQLMTQICRQFEEMHQFLRKREDEIKNDLKHREEDAVEKMSETLHTMETALSESRELEGRVTSALEIKDPERFLKCWSEENNRKTPEHLFRPRADELQVVNTALCLGPYESHLQFFVWKEMLQVIQPRAELLSLKRKSTDLIVSDDGRCIFCAPTSKQSQSDTFSFAFIKECGQTKTSPSFGSTREFGQTTTPPPFGSTRGFGQTTTPPSFGSTRGFGQTTTPPPFGSTREFGQTTTPPIFGFGFGQTATPPPFGQTNPHPSFGSTGGFGKSKTNTFGAESHINPDNCEDLSWLCSLKKTHAFSVNEFSSGQYYWEIDVGVRDYWELGIKENFLKYDGQKYSACNPTISTELSFADRPRKIGIYLNCESKKLSFYDADNMTHIHTVSSSVMPMPLSAYFNIRYREPDPNPMTVCWY
ncbi:nuclear factor 7, ovary isoform X3 [Lates calcarifer]|uniref:Nuclear factor 7, ovary isoform X3 n=1 Tax=Lates calcarifer TaxID=8187 RepID=A0AAJ7PP35_LATCA|nr:nuclear factor 7, ovary isoform X3 [Lates calcarifer]